jgi:hypothetical protein
MQISTPTIASQKTLRVTVTSNPPNHGNRPEKTARSFNRVAFEGSIWFVIWRELVTWRTIVASTGVTRWDEKAGLRRDAVGSQVIDVLEAQEIKETGNEEG